MDNSRRGRARRIRADYLILRRRPVRRVDALRAPLSRRTSRNLPSCYPRSPHPVTIIGALNDRVVPLANAEFLHERLPNSRLVVLDSGHFAWEEAPAEYAAVILDAIEPHTADQDGLCGVLPVRVWRPDPRPDPFTSRGRVDDGQCPLIHDVAQAPDEEDATVGYPDAPERWRFETLDVHADGALLFVRIAAPPMNLLGPELVRDLVSLIQRAEADASVKVLVFMSADPDYFISHVDLNRVAEYRAEAAKLTGEPSIALLFRHLSTSRLVTIAQIQGRVRGAGSEFVLACDMRFAARETSIFGQIEAAFGLLPGGGGAGYLVRVMGRRRALEVLLSADDYDADLAERYGWINRAMPAEALDGFVRALAERIATSLQQATPP